MRSLSLVTLFSLIFISCSSTDEKEIKGSKIEEKLDGAAPSKASKEDASKSDEDNFRSSSRTVTTVLSNSDSALENAIPDSVLADVLMAMEQSSAKKSRDLGFMVTYLGMARLQGRNTDLQRRLEEKVGPLGAKNPWFLLEAVYIALQRKNYGLAEYLIDKAEKLAAADKVAKSAVKHALAVRYLISGKIQTAVNEMRKINAEIAFLPTSLTLGFLALRAGDFNGADSVFKGAAAQYGENANIKIGLAAAARGKGLAQDAISILKPLVASYGQDRRVVWNYALALADNPATKEEAISTLKKYFQLPGSLPEADVKANALLAKLQRPPAPPPPPPVSPKPEAKPAPDAADKVPTKEGNKPAPAAPTKEGNKSAAAPAPAKENSKPAALAPDANKKASKDDEEGDE